MSELTVPSLRLPDEAGVHWTSFTKVLFYPEENWPAQICERPMVVGQVGKHSMALIADPDAAKTVLDGSEERFPKWRTYEQFAGRAVGRQSQLATSGTQWRRQRRAFGPIFGPTQTSRLIGLFHRATTRATAGWNARGGTEIDVFLEMRRIALGNIWQTLFGTEADLEPPAALAAVSDEIHAAQLRDDNKLLAKQLTLLFNETRTRAPESSLVPNNPFEAGDVRSRNLTDQEICDNARLLLAVGHESTALTLTWTLWLLARDHKVQRRVHHEIDRVIGRGAVDASKLPALEFTANVLKETLRLFPALPIVARQSTTSIVLAGMSLPAKTILVVCIYALQRHRNWWDEPDQFRPERFASSEPRHRYAYLPFSAGRHTCLGNAFGWAESLTILTTILQRFRLETTHEVRIRPRAELLWPDRQVRLTVCSRDETPSS